MSAPRPRPRLYARVTVVVVCLLSMFAELSHAQALASLDALRWERRVLLVFVDGETDVQEDVLDALEASADGLAERDVTWFVFADDAPVATTHGGPVAPRLAADLRREFAPIDRPLDVLLIGKDGGLKQRASRLNVASLFTSIDRMPMRRREMQAGDGEAADNASRGL